MPRLPRSLVFGLVVLGSGALPAAGGELAPRPVSPGEWERAVEIASSCPTFSWSAGDGARAYRLALFEVSDEGRAELVWTERVDGAALSWTPARARCLAPGREYAWVVRAERGEDAEPEAIWSPPLRFRVPGVPTTEELSAALELLARWRAAGGAEGGSGDEAAPPNGEGRAGTAGAEASTATGVAAVRGESADLSGNAYGLFGISHSPQGAGVVARNESVGADLVLDGEAQGQADTLLTQSGIDRPSASAQTFDVGNSGAGTMSLTVDGAAVSLAGHLHAGADIATGTVADPRIAGSLTRDSEVMPIVLANDGPGSGLDADTLDGVQAAAFAPATHLHAGADIATGTVADPRIAGSLTRDSEVMPIVLANDGPGSGLDADTLDGVQGSGYQARVLGTCPLGHSMRGVNADGSVDCYEVPVPPRITDLTWVTSGSCLAVALGAFGFPVVVDCGRDGYPQNLVVYRCSDSACAGDVQASIVDSGVSFGGSGYSIAIPADSLPVISYDSAAGALKVAKCNDIACSGGDETITTVDDPANDVGSSSSIAIGADGRPVIAYYDFTAGALKVAKCNNASCSLTTITTVDDPSNDVGFSPSIAIGVDGFPVVSYHDWTAGALKVAKCNDAACAGGDETISVVDDFFNLQGVCNDIAVGADGLPVISYTDESVGGLRVAKCNDVACSGGDEGSWLVHATPNRLLACANSIAIGADGFPVISFGNQVARFNPASFLMVAKCNDPDCAGGNEVVSIVDNAGDGVGTRNEIAIGTDGFPVVAYDELFGGDLRVAKCQNASCRN